ncbi:unnamed protein product, partial [Adineta ricciae]
MQMLSRFPCLYVMLFVIVGQAAFLAVIDVFGCGFSPYAGRACKRQEKRRQQKKALLDILNNIDSDTTSSEDESILDTQNESSAHDQQSNQCRSGDVTAASYPNINLPTYKPDDDDDTYWNEKLTDWTFDPTSSLYENSRVSVRAAAVSVMSIAIECNFPKSVVERLLKILKSLLPVPNSLPTTHASLVKAIGVASTSSSRYYCNSCDELCIARSQYKFCENHKCQVYGRPLRNRDISEIVILDIKDQLKSILRRNMSLFSNAELFPSFDITSGKCYKEHVTSANELSKVYNEKLHLVTLNIHTDGAPLIRTTKSSLWPCLASVVELPPQVREQQSNILLSCLWNSSVKPNVNIFMQDCIQQLLDLANPFTLIINNSEFVIVLKTQLFVSDLPAKALVWKTINFNGYNSCTYCPTEGVYQHRQVLYPYRKNNYQQRTHDQFLAIARVVEERASRRKTGGTIDGIKGLSPLLQAFEYPKQIVFDYMHLCCLGHMSTLIQRWKTMLSSDAFIEINKKIFAQKFPHNRSVKFNYPLNSSEEWKPKHFRVHLHLPQQVLTHGGLSFTSAFCFKSMIRFFKKRAHGTRNLVTQIADWINTATAVGQPSIELSIPT